VRKCQQLQKVDIGAVYNRPPREKKLALGDFYACERELVFDIDLTDYDTVRTCCSDANVCPKCWRFITIAVRVLDYLIREHFGFSHMLWVFSGRRGVHCWVADKRARRLPSRGREAIAKYLKFDPRGTMVTTKRGVHPVAEDACRVLMESGEFDALVEEQGWLDDEAKWSEVLKLCVHEGARHEIHKSFTKCEKTVDPPVARWNLLKNLFDPVTRAKDSDIAADFPPPPGSGNFFTLFLLNYAYPKLDEKVTTGLNHLLKSPFCVHPKSGRVAVPFTVAEASSFDLEKVPRIDKLRLELLKAESAVTEGKENRRQVDAYERTSMAPYIHTFRAFIDGLAVSKEEGGR